MAAAKQILLVEDDGDIASLLRLHLEDEGYVITHEADGAKALLLLEQVQWDAVILDLMLPHVDGLEICRRIRQLTRYLPIIIISARSSETDRITGLETGADDYLAKPFSVQELIARIKALFRRQQAMGQAQTNGQIYAHGLALDPLLRSVQLNGKEVVLTPREFELCTSLPVIPARFSRVWLCSSRSGAISTKATNTPLTPISIACGSR